MMTHTAVWCLLLGLEQVTLPAGWHVDEVRLGTAPARVRCYATIDGTYRQFGMGPLFGEVSADPARAQGSRLIHLHDVRGIACPAAQPMQSAVKIRAHWINCWPVRRTEYDTPREDDVCTPRDERWLRHCARWAYTR